MLPNGLEYSINYLHGYDYSPAVYNRGITVPPLVLHLMRKYERTEMFGASFTKAINSGALAGLAGVFFIFRTSSLL